MTFWKYVLHKLFGFQYVRLWYINEGRVQRAWWRNGKLWTKSYLNTIELLPDGTSRSNLYNQKWEPITFTLDKPTGRAAR